MSIVTGIGSTSSLHGPIEPAEFRSVLGRFATGVTVITAISPDGQRVGVTASSFNTLSLDPPLILWSLGLRAPSLAVFRAAPRFAVNILGADHAAIAMQFARPSDDKFRGLAVTEGLEGTPLLLDAIAHLECEVLRRDPGGDHELYIGHVRRARATDGHPLVFAKGAFGQFTVFG